MKTNIFLGGKESAQILNLATNIFTVILFILYSIVKRLESANAVIYLLLLLFIINLFLSLYALYLNNKHKYNLPDHRKNNVWMTARVVANLGLAVLSFLLLK